MSEAAGQIQDPAMSVRPAEARDAETVVGLCRRVLREVYGARYDTVEPSLPQVGRFWLDNPDFCDGIFVAEAGGRIVGTVQVCGHKVFNLYVERAARARGTGRILLAAAEAEMRRRGVRRAALDVVEEYGEVIGFYEARGWRAWRRHRHLDWKVPLIEMTKDLQPWPPAAARACLWQVPKLLVLVAVLAALLPLGGPILIVTRDAGSLGPAAVVIMAFLALHQLYWLDSAYLRTPARFGRAFMFHAVSVLEMAVAGFTTVILLAALGLAPGDSGPGGAVARLAPLIAILLASRPLRVWLAWAWPKRKAAPAT